MTVSSIGRPGFYMVTPEMERIMAKVSEASLK